MVEVNDGESIWDLSDPEKVERMVAVDGYDNCVDDDDSNGDDDDEDDDDGNGVHNYFDI